MTLDMTSEWTDRQAASMLMPASELANGFAAGGLARRYLRPTTQFKQKTMNQKQGYFSWLHAE